MAKEKKEKPVLTLNDLGLEFINKIRKVINNLNIYIKHRMGLNENT